MHMIETFGKRLKRLREGEKLSQTQLASLIGVDQSTLCSYEGDRRQPPIATLVTLAKWFGVTTDYLLGVEMERALDLSQLSPMEIEIIRSLVRALSEGNEAKIKLQQANRADAVWNEGE